MTATLQPERLAAWPLAVPTPGRPTTTSTVTETIEATEQATQPPFAAIVNEHGGSVFRLAKSVVRDDALADDVAQETFIKVWKNLDSFRGEGSLRGWILRIAHNEAVSTLRRIRDSATDPQRMPEQADAIGTTRIVEGRLAEQELIDALEQLDELSRAIVVLREVEGLSYDDIAGTLAVPIPTVKTRLLRARRELSRQLEDWRVTT